MNKIERFFSYLGCSDKTINERQLIRLICLLGKESNINIKLENNEYDLMNHILDIYINAFETNSFVNLTEHNIAASLSEVS